MSFPDFNEFLNTLTEDRLNDLFKDINQVEIVQIADLSPASISTFINKVRNETLGNSVSLALRILEAYHEWLSSQMP